MFIFASLTRRLSTIFGPPIRPIDKLPSGISMRIFVISLPTQTERRHLVRSELEKANMEFSFFDGIDIEKTRNEYFQSFDVERFKLITGRHPLANEIGCYASHLTLWRTCIALNEPIIVLEDDVCVDSQFENAMSFIKSNVRKLGFIRLEKNCKTPGPTVSAAGHYSAQYCQRYPYSAKAYALSPEVAMKFVEASHTFDAPVDKFIKDFWVHGQPLYQLTPHIVDEGEIGLRTTTIGARHKPQRRRLSTRLRRMSYKAHCSLSRFLFNMTFRYQRVRQLANSPQNSHKIPVAGRIGNQ